MKFHSIALNEGATARNLTIQGGTSFPTSPGEGELFYRSDADARIKGLYLYVNGSWDRISSTEALTVPSGAVLPASSNAGDLFYQTGSGMFFSDGTTWSALSAGGAAATADDLSGGNAGSLPYQAAAGSTAFLTAGTINQVLVSGTTPSWTGTPVLSTLEATQLITNMSGPVGTPALEIGSNPSLTAPIARFRSGGTTVLTLDKTGILSLDGVVSSVTINSTANGNSANVFFQQTGLNRWRMGKDTTSETGANAGSDFFINSYQDNGSTINTRVSISRSSGVMTVPAGINANVTGTLTGNASSASTVPWTGVTGRPTLHYSFTNGAPSPAPTSFPIESISGFNAYSSTDFPSSYWTGVTVLNPGLSGFQLAANWDSEEIAPSGLIFRVNDDTTNAAAWGPWTTIWNSQNLTSVSQLTNDAGYATSASISSGYVAKTGDTMTGDLVIARANPVLRLRDTDGTLSNMTSFVSFRDGTDTERGWVGFGTANNVLRLSNSIGDIRLSASNVFVDTNILTTDSISVDSLNAVTSMTIDGIAVGYLGIPGLPTGGGSAGTEVKGKCLETTGAITVPSGVFVKGDTFTIDNVGGSAITVIQGSGLTMYLAGTTTTGNRSLAVNGICTIRFRSASVCVISGGGLT